MKTNLKLTQKIQFLKLLDENNINILFYKTEKESKIT